MLVSVACFSVMDSMLKLLSEHYPSLQVAFLRARVVAAVRTCSSSLRVAGSDASGRSTSAAPAARRAVGADALQLRHRRCASLRSRPPTRSSCARRCSSRRCRCRCLKETVVGGQWLAIAIGLVGRAADARAGERQVAFDGLALGRRRARAPTAVAIVSLRLLSRTDSTESMVLRVHAAAHDRRRAHWRCPVGATSSGPAISS